MTRPKRTCTEPGCPVLVTKGYCLRHNRNRRLRVIGERLREKRESSSERTYDHRWQKLRKIVLARDPICKNCEAAPSTEVDHIVPRRPDQHAADVTEEQLQGLCKPCHSKKTRAEQEAARLDYTTERILEESEEVVIGLPCEPGEAGFVARVGKTSKKKRKVKKPTP